MSKNDMIGGGRAMSGFDDGHSGCQNPSHKASANLREQRVFVGGRRMPARRKMKKHSLVIQTGAQSRGGMAAEASSVALQNSHVSPCGPSP